MTLTVEVVTEVLMEIDATKQEQLRLAVMSSAIRYASLRAEWWLLDAEARQDADPRRAAAHDALIDSLNILSRSQARVGESNQWRGKLGQDRKTIGDFACWATAILGLRAR